MKHTSFPKVKTEKRAKTYTTASPMSNDKTASCILRMNANVPKPQIEGVINAMHEYSAQQLKEYRDVIRELLPIVESFNYAGFNSYQLIIDRARKLIDQTYSTK